MSGSIIPTVTISTGVSAPGFNIGVPTTQILNSTPITVQGTGPTQNFPNIPGAGGAAVPVVTVAPVGVPPAPFVTPANTGVFGTPNPTPSNIPPTGAFAGVPSPPGTVPSVTPAISQNNIATPKQFGP